MLPQIEIKKFENFYLLPVYGPLNPMVVEYTEQQDVHVVDRFADLKLINGINTLIKLIMQVL